MRIGFFTDTYTPQINGVVTSIQLFKKALEERGHDVYVFAPTPDQFDDGDDTVRFKSMPFVFQPEMRLAIPLSMEAARLVDEVELDIIHSHDPFSIGLFGLVVARRHKIPYVHTYHTLYPEYVHYVWDTRFTQRMAERLSKDFCQMCDAIVAPSTKIESYLHEWGVTTDIEIIATGIDTGRWSAADPALVEALRTRLGIEPQDKIALFVGRLGSEKNVEFLIRALWHSHTPELKLVIGGDGPERQALENLAENLGLSDRVLFAGYLENGDVSAAYHLADFFAFASTSETQGLVIGEALASGLPVVTVEDPAVQDFVTDGETGLVVHAMPEQFARAMDRLAADPGLVETMGRTALERSIGFSIEHQAELLEELYEQALERYEPRTVLGSRVEALYKLVQSAVGKIPKPRR